MKNIKINFTRAAALSAAVWLCATGGPALAQRNSSLLKAGSVKRLSQEAVRAKKAMNALRLQAKTYSAGALRRQKAVAFRIKADMRRQAAYQAARNFHKLEVFPAIAATAPDQLRTDAYRLSPSQRAEETRQYYELMTRFSSLKTMWDARLFYLELYPRSNPIGTLEKQDLLDSSLRLIVLMGMKLDYMFASDVPLRRAHDYLVERVEKLEPAYYGVFRRDKLARRTDRAFSEEEFFLRNPADGNLRDVRWEDYQPSSADARAAALAIAKELPQNLRIALVNDHEGMINSFRYWANLGYFGEGAELTAFSSVEALLAGPQAFDVIVTDVLVPGGGGRYLAQQLRTAGSVTPIIALSEYREEDARAEELFNFGIDGYIFADDTFRNYIGYRVFPALLKNYFEMRARLGWKH